MLRRSTNRLFLRRTEAKKSEVIFPITDPKKMPSADEATGLLYRPYLGGMKLLRVVDPRWILNRMEMMKRDGLMGMTVWYAIFTNFLWFQPQKALWGDGAPPRKVDWNVGTAGELPAGFNCTKV